MDHMRHVQSGAELFPEDAASAEMYDDLLAEIGGELKPQQHIMLVDIVTDEKLKVKLREDIAKRGLGEMARNGRQSYWRENKSVSQLMKLIDQQRRNLQALGLVSKLRDQSDDEPDDGGFEDF